MSERFFTAFSIPLQNSHPSLGVNEKCCQSKCISSTEESTGPRFHDLGGNNAENAKIKAKDRRFGE
jgi:hypothetical protein